MYRYCFVEAAVAVVEETRNQPETVPAVLRNVRRVLAAEGLDEWPGFMMVP